MCSLIAVLSRGRRARRRVYDRHHRAQRENGEGRRHGDARRGRGFRPHVPRAAIRRSQCAPHLQFRATRTPRATKSTPVRSRVSSAADPPCWKTWCSRRAVRDRDGRRHFASGRTSNFLERVADDFQLRAATRSTGFVPRHLGPDQADPYVVLGVSYSARVKEEIKHTYRMLVRENHPDSLMARGVPEEFLRLANEKLAAINVALCKDHQRTAWLETRERLDRTSVAELRSAPRRLPDRYSGAALYRDAQRRGSAGAVVRS